MQKNMDDIVHPVVIRLFDIQSRFPQSKFPFNVASVDVTASLF